MASLEEYLKDNTNVTLSYAFRIRGMPYNWTDNRGAWSSALFPVEKAGGLANNAISIKHTSDPLKPLKTGTGVTVALLDDQTGYLRKLVAPGYGEGYRITAEVTAEAASPVSVSVEDTSAYSVGQDVFMGKETFNVASITPSTTVSLTRAQYGTFQMDHKIKGFTGPRLSTSPISWGGRYGELVCAPINEIDGTVDTSQEWPIWAGVVNAVSKKGKAYSVTMGTLSSALDKGWPHSLATGKIQGLATSDEPAIYVTEQDFILYFSTDAGGGAIVEYAEPIGKYLYITTTLLDITPYEGIMDLATAAKALANTVENYAGLGASAIFRSNIQSVIRDNGSKASYVSLVNIAGSKDVTIHTDRGFGALFRRYNNRPIFAGTDGGYRIPSGTVLDGVVIGEYLVLNNTLGKFSTEIEVVMDSPENPYTVTYTNRAGDSYGFAMLDGGGNRELIKYGSVTVDKDIATLHDVQRGQGKMPSREWGKESTDVTVNQVWAMDGTFTLGELLVSLLCSTGKFEQQLPDLDNLTYGHGLAVPKEYIDVDGMVGELGNTLPKPGMVWVEDAGKGGKQLEELLKLAGAYMVAKRFWDGSTWRFGLGLDMIDQPTTTRYDHTVTDSDRLAGRQIAIDYNERLIVNAIQFKPFWDTSKDEPEGGDIYEYDSSSIADFGMRDPLEFSPRALFNVTSTRGTTAGDKRSIDIYNATRASLRWFGAFSRGVYSIRIPTTLAGWRYEVGDDVSVTLTGVDDVNGGSGVTSLPAKVTEVKHTHGQGARAEIELSASYRNIVELAPCASIASVGGAGLRLTLADNYFTDDKGRPPFAAQGGQYVKDVHYFDRAVHGEDIEVRIFREWDESVEQIVSVTSTDTAGGVLTIASALTGALQTAVAGGEPVIVTFADYDNASTSTLEKQYAYITNNTGAPDPDKEYV